MEDLINDVRATMPPIAGVANGAMVLQDTAIREMTTEVLNKVLGPKVDGSRYLDEILQADQLDFFVFFSSLATVFGNHGQSNYTAANMYMNALAGQRRKKGQAGSVIAIGAVTGIGYMARVLSEKDLIRIKGTGYSSLSERDFHQLFCEGILAGKPASGLNLEVISGVQIGQSGDKRPAVWHTNPMFAHCIVKRDELRQDDLAHGLLPLKTSLLAVKTREEALQVISGEDFRLPITAHYLLTSTSQIRFYTDSKACYSQTKPCPLILLLMSSESTHSWRLTSALGFSKRSMLTCPCSRSLAALPLETCSSTPWTTFLRT